MKVAKGLKKKPNANSAVVSFFGEKKKAPGKDTPPWTSKELHLLADAAPELLLPT